VRISNELEERKKEEERERKKMPFIVATYVYASSQGQRTHSARTNYKKARKPLQADMQYALPISKTMSLFCTQSNGVLISYFLFISYHYVDLDTQGALNNKDHPYCCIHDTWTAPYISAKQYPYK
jgi:hypothetical protein